MRLKLQPSMQLLSIAKIPNPIVGPTLRLIAVCLLLLSGAFSASLTASIVASTQVEAAVVNSISVRGNQRVDSDTIISYVTVRPGRSFSSFDTDESLRALFATGLFADVQIDQRGRVLIVTVDENPTVNTVRFEGNDKVKDERLALVTQLKSLSIFSQEKLDSDVERVREVVRRSGRNAASVTSRVEPLDNNRVNVVYIINEGGRTKITDINFIGNNAYSDRRLTEIISHNESNFLSWLKRDDIYDPDKLRSDEGRLRTFYFNRGYADFQVISAVAELDEGNNSYSITITVDEGDRYRFGAVTIDNALPNVDTESLRSSLLVQSGDTYSARAVERTLVKITETIAGTGFAFAEVTPRGERDFDNRTINITFYVDEGPRVYIERIEISGNSRTRGYVIRREFDISEGDAYNRVLVNKAKKRLDDLGFFERVNITTRQGSAPDRVIVVVDVVDKSTGEISVGGGYSTNSGPIAEISLTEKNFLGRGQYLKLSGGRGENSTQYNISFTEPYFLGHRIAAGFDLTRDSTTPGNGVSYSQEVNTARLRAGAFIAENLTLGLNYTFQHEQQSISGTTAISPAILASINQSPYVTSAIGYALVYSTLDSRKLPRQGIHASVNQTFAGVGGDANYVRTTGRISAYFLAAEDADIVLLGAVGGGYVRGFGNGTLRVTDHFYQGGETVRGFDTRGLGPRDLVTGEALGGTTYANATAEVQFPLPFFPTSYGLRGAVFGEAGTLYNNEYNGALSGNAAQQAASRATFGSSAIRASVGASIIWDSPFGPLRVDFARALKKESYDQTQFFKFGISSKF